MEVLHHRSCIKGRMSHVWSGRISMVNLDNDQLSLIPELKNRHLVWRSIDQQDPSQLQKSRHNRWKRNDWMHNSFIVYECILYLQSAQRVWIHSPYLFKGCHKRMFLKGGESLLLKRDSCLTSWPELTLKSFNCF